MSLSRTARGAVLLASGAALLLAASNFARRPTESDALAVAVRRTFAEQVDSLDVSLRRLSVVLGQAAVGDSLSSRRIPPAFRAARGRYKRIEGMLEFYAPALAAAFNSRRQEVDDDDAPPPSTLAAGGFPALEDVLGRSLDDRPDSAQRIVDAMQPLVERLRGVVPGLAPTAAQAIEIARLEIARVSTLGIAGFDAPRTGDAMREGAEALEGVRLLLGGAGPIAWPGITHERRSLDSTIARAVAYLRDNPGFETFNRLAFITFYAEPAARALDELRRVDGVASVLIRRAWRVTAPSVYGASAFDPRVYAPSGAPVQSAELVSLGRRLFFDASLSGTGTRSCASCHDPKRAFTDGVPRPASLVAHERVLRNTPTLLNAAIQPAQFADERSVTLEDQVLEVLRSPAEMASSVDAAAATVDRVASYRSAFARAFHDTSSHTVTPLRLRQALAAFVRSLVSLDSRFDRAVRGDTSAMTTDERRGFTVFMGKGACGTCHFAPLFSGNTPPLYIGSDVEVIGTSVSPSTPGRLDPDSGRARIDRLPLHLRAFKTPTLRNVALTAPYMHNGAFRTLDDVLAFYDHGGGAGAGASITNQTLAADSLHLTASDRRAIIAFLGALTDTSRVIVP